MDDKSKIKSLNSNCADLARLLISPDSLASQSANESYWLQVSDWLLVAGGIVKVELDREVLDSDGYAYCRPVYEFEVDRNELHGAMVMQLAKFSFIWGCLETVLDVISAPAAPKPNHRGKINAACYYLKQNLAASSTLDFYDQFLDSLKKLIQYVPYYSDLATEFSPKPHVDHHGLGVYIVYKIRNRFAHGALSLPLPDDDIKKNPDKILIHTSCHIVLLTIQMLISAFLRNESFDIRLFPIDDEEEDDEGEKVNIHELLRTIHIKDRPFYGPSRV